MKILHACLANYYIDNMAYQENMLVRQHRKEGHEVLVIASTETLSSKNVLTYDEPGRHSDSNGAEIVRLRYSSILPPAVGRKVRAYVGLRAELDRFKPDVVLLHGLSCLAAVSLARWCRATGTPYFVDTHSDDNNSGRSLFSREVLHRRFYGPIARFAAKHASKVLCISLDTLDFAHDVYRIPRAKLELFPLGGVLPSASEKLAARTEWQRRLGISSDTTLIVQSGKFGPLKRLDVTLETLKSVTQKKFHVVLAGAFDPTLETVFENRLRDLPHVSHIGWVAPDTLFSLLAAADIYLQPGSQSVTMQQAICSGCAVILDDVKSHRPYIDGNGALIEGGNPFAPLLNEWLAEPLRVKEMGKESEALAAQMLDYRILAKRIFPAHTHRVLP